MTEGLFFNPSVTFFLPGTGELPVSPVYEDGEKTVTLKGEKIADEFEEIIDAYVVRTYATR